MPRDMGQGGRRGSKTGNVQTLGLCLDNAASGTTPARAAGAMTGLWGATAPAEKRPRRRRTAEPSGSPAMP